MDVHIRHNKTSKKKKNYFYYHLQWNTRIMSHQKDLEDIYSHDSMSSINSGFGGNDPVGLIGNQNLLATESEYFSGTAPSIAEEAASRTISRIQSKHSGNGIKVEGTAVGIDRTATVLEESKYSRFTPRKKDFIVAIGAGSCFLSPMSSLAFLPAIPEISTDFRTTGEILNISAAVYNIFMAISPCIFSPILDIYGRRFCFNICLSLFTISTVLCAVAQNLVMFYVFRALAALFGTAFFSVTAHMVGDIYPPEQRGTAMGWVLSGTQIGSAFGPVIGGIIVTYTLWRVIFGVLAALGFILAVVVYFFLPETSLETKHQIVLREAQKYNPKKKFVWINFNPFKVIYALKYPNLFLGGFIVMGLTYTMYGLLTPIRYVVDPRFNLTSPIFGALFYLPPGLGYFFGSLFGGRFADVVVKYFKKKKGRRIPEDRIYATLVPLGLVYPACMIIYGWSLEKEKGGMAVPIIFMFLSGVAQTFVFPAANTYCVDSMPEIGGDAVGSSYFSRNIAGAVASATCLKSINSIGVGWTCTISGFILWVSFAFAVILIWKGEDLRKAALKKDGLRNGD